MKRFFKKLYYVPRPTLNTSAKRNLSKMNDLMKDWNEPLLLNIGSGERIIGGENLENKNIKKIIKLDIYPYSTVDVIADAHQLPFRKSAFQGIICQAVLEHTQEPEKVVVEMDRVLDKDGILYVEVPFLQGYHPSPTDYHRFTLEGIHQLFSGFLPIDSGVCVGPSSALSWILREFLSALFTGFSERRRLREIALFVFGWLTFPIKYLDFILAKKAGAHRIASGLYFFGKKN